MFEKESQHEKICYSNRKAGWRAFQKKSRWPALEHVVAIEYNEIITGNANRERLARQPEPTGSLTISRPFQAEFPSVTTGALDF